MKLKKSLASLLPMLMVLLVLVPWSLLYAEEFTAFDSKKVKLLTSDEKKTKLDVEKLFGKPDTSAPIQKTQEGCVELWVYTKIVMTGRALGGAEILYVGFNGDGLVCSAEVKIVKPK